MLTYTGAVALVVVATSIRLVLFADFAEANLLFFGAVTIAAWFGGSGPAVATTFLGTLATMFFFVPPKGSFEITNTHDWLVVGLTLLEGLLIASVSGRLHSKRIRALEENVRTEQERDEASDGMRALFELSPTAMLLIDAESLAVTDVNGAAIRLYGYDRARFTQLTTRDLAVGDDGANFEEAKAMTSQLRRHRTATGRAIEVEAVTRVIHHLGRRAFLKAVVDVTERRELEARATQAQKMEAMGRLAGGVAHDFNNLLTVIRSSAEFLLEDFENDPSTASIEDVRNISAAGERAANLTKQLLAFSRRQVLQPQPVDVQAAIERMQPMLRTLVGDRVALEVDAGTPVHTLIDPTQLEQVVINLVANARDAITANGGHVSVTTRRATANAAFPREGSSPRTGSWVVLSVRDTGAGMDAATKARMFEPFFTTKGSGKGTGLGLATVSGIVEQAGGHIRVESAVGVGTLFEIILPELARVGETASAGQTLVPPARGSGQTVLLVDDEEAVRKVTLAALRRFGFEVIVATSPGEALFLFERHRDDIDILVTDVEMPHLSGPELAKRVRHSRPDLPVLFMSGYAQDETFRAQLATGAPFLQKPFSHAALSRAVLDALGTTDPSNPPDHDSSGLRSLPVAAAS